MSEDTKLATTEPVWGEVGFEGWTHEDYERFEQENNSQNEPKTQI